MKLFRLKKISLFFVLVTFLISLTGCEKDFYLSEHETKAYESIFASESALNLHFDNLQGRIINLTFDNSTGTPRLSNTNLLTEMRRTELANLEQGLTSVSLSRLNSELENQINNWIENKLSLYTTDNTDDRVRLTELTDVSILIINNPTFSFLPEKQSIAFDIRLEIVINGEIEVNAVSWLINFFANVNGTYPLQIRIPDLRLQGEANIHSPFVNGGRINFNMIPNISSPIRVINRGVSIPNAVRDGIIHVLTHNLSQKVDEVFLQEYDHFALSQIYLTPKIGQNVSRLKVSYRSKADSLGPDAVHPQIHVVSRKSDGKLYHSRKSNADWSKYKVIPFSGLNSTPYSRFENDPTLFHSGNGQLELAATNQGGDLVYIHWREEKWDNTKIIVPNTNFNPAIRYVGKPAVAASAPGQAEIIVVGSDGNLWHLRRKNGVWVTPFKLPLNGYPNLFGAFRDPVAVYVGNKIVVTFADVQNYLFAIAFDLETENWGQPTPFKTSSGANVEIEYAPAMVASGENRVDVAYAKPGGFVFHRILHIQSANIPNLTGTGISFSNNESNTSGKTNASPILTASTFHQPELFVRGLNDYLYHNHFVNSSASFLVDGITVNPGWQGWTAINKFLFSDKQKTDGKISNFSVAGTKTGKIEVVARGKPKYSYQPDINLHNEFQSERFARPDTPWKAVNWRGWDATGNDQFFGRPAVAVVDQNFQIANIGNRANFGETVHTQRIGATNQSYLYGLTSKVKINNSITDPIILSSGVGTFDTIALLKTGEPQHTRFFSNGSTTSKQLIVPAGVEIKNFSATSYGNGFVDLAANASNQKVYFWRFRDGVWSLPIEVANQIISAPILKYTGAAQLELLTIGVDNNLIRRQFVSNSWQSEINVTSNFPIDEKRFSPLSASSWGDGTVDLVVVDKNTNKLFHRRIGSGVFNCTGPIGCPPPRTFNPVNGFSLETPVLTAFSPTKLNLLSMQGLKWHSSWSSKIPFQPVPAPRDIAIQWSTHKYIGGDEMIIGGTAQTGSNNFVSIAVMTGQFYINRNINGNWTGFQPIIGQQSQQILKQPIFLPAITAMGNQ